VHRLTLLNSPRNINSDVKFRPETPSSEDPHTTPVRLAKLISLKRSYYQLCLQIEHHAREFRISEEVARTDLGQRAQDDGLRHAGHDVQRSQGVRRFYDPRSGAADPAGKHDGRERCRDPTRLAGAGAGTRARDQGTWPAE